MKTIRVHPRDPRPLLVQLGLTGARAACSIGGVERTQPWLWLVFGAIVLVMLVLDLGVFHRRSHPVRFKEALVWCGVWVALALGFMLLIHGARGWPPALEFLTGYLIEESLSIDNLFVFLLVFSYFAIPAEHQHSVLFWGIIGAMICRAIFIVAGVALIERFQWAIYVFGLILIYSGVKLALQQEAKVNPERNPFLKLCRRLLPVTKDCVGHRFLVKRDGRTWATPLLVVLIVVETTDLIFAVDSIPAVMAITRDPFIIYTSNIFAVMGLRSMYFALAGAMTMFHHLHYGLSAVLVFVGGKMLLTRWQIEIPIGVALGVVGGLLLVSVVASLVWPKKTDGGDPG